MKIPPGFKYLILAVVVGLVAVFLIQRYIRSKLAVAPKPTRPVVVAEVDIPAGTALESRLLKVASWPGDIVPPNSLSSPQQLKGRVVLIPISKGEPILESRLAPEGTAAGLSGLLDRNSLAVTVKTDEVSGVAGFINPGDRIDMLVELPQGGEGGKGHLSKIILQNLKVLSKGQVWDQTGDKKPKVVPTVTLEVSPKQAEMVNLATNRGRIRLALRNQANTDFFATQGVDMTQLLNRPPAPENVATLPSGEQQQPSGPKAQMIKGMRVSQIQFK